jgi:hypothetical protein
MYAVYVLASVFQHPLALSCVCAPPVRVCPLLGRTGSEKILHAHDRETKRPRGELSLDLGYSPAGFHERSCG